MSKEPMSGLQFAVGVAGLALVGLAVGSAFMEGSHSPPPSPPAVEIMPDLIGMDANRAMEIDLPGSHWAQADGYQRPGCGWQTPDGKSTSPDYNEGWTVVSSGVPAGQPFGNNTKVTLLVSPPADATCVPYPPITSDDSAGDINLPDHNGRNHFRSCFGPRWARVCT